MGGGGGGGGGGGVEERPRGESRVNSSGIHSLLSKAITGSFLTGFAYKVARISKQLIKSYYCLL